MGRMLLVLKRSPEQEAALERLMDGQLDKFSSNYHKWLTPEQFGQDFGPSDEDIQAIASWLASHGFQVAHVSKGRTVIEFSGTAGQVQETFRTSIHKYVVDGEEHWANANDPEIPSALTPVVVGVDSLHNFPKKPMVTFPTPCSGSGLQGGGSCFGLGPYDFATIYNVLPLWNVGIDGAGQTIAIVAASNINIQDVRDFRNLFGLPAKDPVIIVNGPDPGVVQNQNGNRLETEADSDVEWAGAVARGATIDLVVSKSTNSTFGADLSAEYIVNHNLAPILSGSYSFCELTLGTAGNQFHNMLWQQAAAQGITVFHWHRRQRFGELR
jgi:subtilase family serine protease